MKFVLMLLALGQAWALDGSTVMKKNEEARKVNEIQATATMTLSGGKRKVSNKGFTLWRKLDETGTHFKSLTKFDKPTQIKDEAILFLEKPEGANEVLLYLPAYKKVRRVEGQQQGSSFMGSDFNYSDITTPHENDFSHKLLKTENCPVGKGKCFKIESTPKPHWKERTGYSLQVSWIHDGNFMASQVEYYDGSGLIKRLTAHKIEKVDGGKWFSHDLTMEHLKKKQKTRLQFTNVKVNKGIPDSLFSKARFGK